MEALWKLSATDQAEGIKSGTFTALDVTESVLARINAADGEVNAVVDIDPDDARSAAGQADEAVKRGDQLGPLHGVPVTIKVNVDVKGRANTNGIPAFKDLVSPDHSPVVKNLVDAGAIIVARTNTPEFSMRAVTDNPLYGLTRNPWNLAMSPGGSSGGAGASAANGYGAIHHGNDIGGSLRFPATQCGVATVKPGFGRVPAFNPSATAERGLLSQLMSVQGAISREVKDVRLATEVMIKHDPRDPWHVPMPFESDPLKASDPGVAKDGRPKIGYCKDHNGYPIHPDVVRNLDRAATILEAAGYQVEEVETPPIIEAANGWFNVAILEIKTTLDPLSRQYGSKTIQKVFDDFYEMSDMVDAEGYMVGIAERSRMVREWNVMLADYPLVLTPFLMRPSYPTDYDETFDGLKDLFDSAIYSFGLNYLGFPAGIIPIDLIEDMPSGVQIVGQKWCEDLILDAMETIEDSTGVMAHHLWEK